MRYRARLPAGGRVGVQPDPAGLTIVDDEQQLPLVTGDERGGIGLVRSDRRQPYGVPIAPYIVRFPERIRGRRDSRVEVTVRVHERGGRSGIRAVVAELRDPGPAARGLPPPHSETVIAQSDH